MEAWLNTINHPKTSHDFSSFVLALNHWASAITFSAVLAAFQASFINHLIWGKFAATFVKMDCQSNGNQSYSVIYTASPFKALTYNAIFGQILKYQLLMTKLNYTY